MKRKRPSKSFPKNLDSMCGQPGPDDGVDPRDFFKPLRQRRDYRKDWQLCRQVFETLSYVLSGESHDELLRNLLIVDVVPAPDARRLLISVQPLVCEPDFNPIAVLERLQASTGRLRSQIAQAVSRRKVPELVFRVLPNDPSIADQGGVQ